LCIIWLTVEVYCSAAPAKFYDIVALDSQNSIGRTKKGFMLSTGSGCEREAQVIAKLLNDGMLKME